MTHPLRPDWLQHMRAQLDFQSAPGSARRRLPSGEAPARTARDRSADATLALLREPYLFASRRCDALRSDLVETRLWLQPAILMRGAEAARLFHDPARFARRGSERIEADRIARLVILFVRAWEEAVPAWAASGSVRLHAALQPLLTRAACAWMKLPLAEAELDLRSRQLGDMLEPDSAAATLALRPRLARIGAKCWLERLVREHRATGAALAEDGMAAILAMRRGRDCRSLSPEAAADALLGRLRPIVAAATPIAFAVHALALHPEMREALAGGARHALRGFVQEVRRFYPLRPPLTARVRAGFEWRGATFPTGRRVMLDIFGTNRHRAWWEQPESFRPERFLGLDPDPFSLLPRTDEAITFALTEAAVDLLVRRTRYQLPAQDLAIDLRRVPALPRSGIVMKDPKLA